MKKWDTDQEIWAKVEEGESSILGRMFMMPTKSMSDCTFFITEDDDEWVWATWMDIYKGVPEREPSLVEAVSLLLPQQKSNGDFLTIHRVEQGTLRGQRRRLKELYLQSSLKALGIHIQQVARSQSASKG